MARRIIAVSAALLACLTLTGCGRGTADVEAAGTATIVEERP